MGWKSNQGDLSSGSLVFVYNLDEEKIDTCFELINKSKKIGILWEDEVKKDEVIYPNRWDAYLKSDNLDIPLRKINLIPPFDKQKLFSFFRSRYPIPLTSKNNIDNYKEFSNYLVDCLNNSHSKNKTTSEDEELELNQFYKKQDISKKFEIGAFGGIRVNAKKNLVVVFIDAVDLRKTKDHGRNIYHDYYDENSDLYFYTGQGQIGDQNLLKRGNKWLYDSISNSNINVHLFRQYHQGGKHEYLGLVNVISHKQELQQDANGTARKVIIFTLKPFSFSL